MRLEPKESFKSNTRIINMGYSNNHRVGTRYCRQCDSRFGTPIADVYGLKKTTGYVASKQNGLTSPGQTGFMKKIQL